ncbi:MAG TPA: TolC family outer membrane protein [Steroidobacteraceae bacterium]|nr:TolC family outer membrane protein [Steroidobacteraceae bacterium]
MKLTSLRRAAVASVALLLPALAVSADLAEIYQRALRNDPILREAEANRLAALEARPQALSALLPQLTGTAGYTRDVTSGTSPYFVETGPNGQGTFIPLEETTTSDIRQWTIQLRQTVFRWGQFSTLKQAGEQVAQAEVDYRAAQESVILRTATAYFNVLAARDTLEAAEASREAIVHQLEQAQKRYEVGLIAITDVEDAKAAADQSSAAVIEAKRTLASTREQLRELTGDAFDELSRPGDDMPLVAPSPASEEQWVRAALDQNLTLSSARLAVDIARETIVTARAGHLPTIDIVASRNGNDTGAYTQAFGATYPADTLTYDKQIGVQLTVPLYSGGNTSSRVREAVYRHRAARERLEQTARETERQTRDAYLGVISEIARVQALKQALASSQTALQATEAGYDVGTRTAVDVLLARQRLLDAQTNYARSRYDYVINVLTLEQAAGTLDESRLTRVNSWLGQTVSVK